MTYAAPLSTGSIASDFNGDGRMDIFVGSQSSPFLGTVLLQGNFPVLSVTPADLTFAQQAIDTTGAAQSLTLSNSGNAALTVSKVGLAGTDAGDYSETNNCGATLAVNASCQVSISFTPTAQGTRTAVLDVNDNAPGSPQTVAISGTTTPAPALTLSSTTVVFPGQYVGTSGLPQTVTLKNSGDAMLTIAGATTSSTDFGVLNACGGSLTAGSSCSIGVFFDPTASGSRTGTLTITDDASGSPQSVALSGMGQDFSLSASSSSDTIMPGQSASYVIAVNPIAGFNQAVTLSCSGAPTGSTCSMTQNSVALTGSTPATVTVSVTTVGSSVRHPAALHLTRGGMAIYLTVCGFPGFLVFMGSVRKANRKKLTAIRWIAFLAILGVSLTGCSGGSSGSGGTSGTGGSGTPA